MVDRNPIEVLLPHLTNMFQQGSGNDFVPAGAPVSIGPSYKDVIAAISAHASPEDRSDYCMDVGALRVSHSLTIGEDPKLRAYFAAPQTDLVTLMPNRGNGDESALKQTL